MAHYTYKTVRNLVPDSYQTTGHYRRRHCAPECAATPCFANCEYEGGADYDGDLWTVTADYIEDLVAVAQGLYPTDLREAWTFWRPIADLGPDDRAILGVWVHELWVTADNQRLPPDAPVWTHFLLIPAPPAPD